MVRLDNLSTYCQPKAEADIAGGEKWLGHFFNNISFEAGAIVLNFDADARTPFTIGFSLSPNTDHGIGRIGLKRVQHYLGKSMFERGTIASHRYALTSGF